MRQPKISFRAVIGAIALFCSLAFGQQTVILAPYPQLQFFTQAGKPLASGCVFTYQSQTTNALATYTDFTGTVLNANPVILNAGGSANIWMLAGQAYRFIVKSAGGTNCALGTTQYTVDGIGAGTSQQTSTVTPSAGSATFLVQAQNQLFTLTLTADTISQPLSAVGIIPPAFITFQITQDGVGNHAFTWPANTIGGSAIGKSINQVTTQSFIWNGANATAIGPAVEGNGPIVAIGTLVLSGSISSPAFISTTANPSLTGIFRMASGDSIGWRNNANGADLLLGKSAADNLTWPNGLSLGGGTALATTNQSGTGALCLVTNCALTTPTLTAPTIGVATATSLACGIVSKTGNYTLTTSDCIVQGSVTGGGFTFTLPHTATGQLWHLTRTDASTNTLTVAGDSGNVNGVASLKIPPRSTLDCSADGSNSWCTISVSPSSQPLIQATRLTGSATTFTYPVQYTGTPTCICSGEGGSCNILTVSNTSCTLNTLTVPTNDVVVFGVP